MPRQDPSPSFMRREEAVEALKTLIKEEVRIHAKITNQSLSSVFFLNFRKNVFFGGTALSPFPIHMFAFQIQLDNEIETLLRRQPEIQETEKELQAIRYGPLIKLLQVWRNAAPAFIALIRSID
jgi:hypothetical protein